MPPSVVSALWAPLGARPVFADLGDARRDAARGRALRGFVQRGEHSSGRAGRGRGRRRGPHADGEAGPGGGVASSATLNDRGTEVGRTESALGPRGGRSPPPERSPPPACPQSYFRGRVSTRLGSTPMRTSRARARASGPDSGGARWAFVAFAVSASCGPRSPHRLAPRFQHCPFLRCASVNLQTILTSRHLSP